jgi:protein phosphatase slingshot
MAFAMKEYKMSLADAMSHVKSKRSIVNPNEGFISQLQAYEGILKARYERNLVGELTLATICSQE